MKKGGEYWKVHDPTGQIRRITGLRVSQSARARGSEPFRAKMDSPFFIGCCGRIESVRMRSCSPFMGYCIRYVGCCNPCLSCCSRAGTKGRIWSRARNILKISSLCSEKLPNSDRGITGKQFQKSVWDRGCDHPFKQK